MPDRADHPWAPTGECPEPAIPPRVVDVCRARQTTSRPLAASPLAPRQDRRRTEPVKGDNTSARPINAPCARRGPDLASCVSMKVLPSASRQVQCASAVSACDSTGGCVLWACIRASPWAASAGYQVIKKIGDICAQSKKRACGQFPRRRAG